MPSRTPLTRLGDSVPCKACNDGVLNCFATCVVVLPLNFMMPPGVQYYCAKRHQFVSISGDFPTVDEARKQCVHDYPPRQCCPAGDYPSFGRNYSRPAEWR
jgi:hypothetical protein